MEVGERNGWRVHNLLAYSVSIETFPCGMPMKNIEQASVFPSKVETYVDSRFPKLTLKLNRTPSSESRRRCDGTKIPLQTCCRLHPRKLTAGSPENGPKRKRRHIDPNHQLTWLPDFQLLVFGAGIFPFWRISDCMQIHTRVKNKCIYIAKKYSFFFFASRLSCLSPNKIQKTDALKKQQWAMQPPNLSMLTAIFPRRSRSQELKAGVSDWI